MIKKYEKYKDSGVEWIGEVPEHWEVRKLKTTIKGVSNGLWGNEPKGNDNDLIVLRVADFNRQRARINEKNLTLRNIRKNDAINKILKKGDLLIEKSGGGDNQLVGYVVLFDSSIKAITSNFVATMRPLIDFDSSYLCYLFGVLYSLDINILSIKQTTGIQNIDTGQYLDEKYYFPPLPEQQKIAFYLDKKSEAIDKFIKNKEHLINLLEEEKKATITKAITKGLDKNVKLKNSGADWLGEIPEHWKTYRTKFLFSLIAQPSGRKHSHELLSIYTDIGVKPRQELAEKGNKASSTDGYWLVKKGDFIVNKLLAWMGAIGLSEYDGVTSPAYDILRKNRSLDEYYYNYLFRCGVLFEEIKKYSKGIMEMRLRLYFTEFSKIFLPYPPLEEQQAIVAHLDNECKKIDDLKAKYRQEIDLIKEYKERLIYDVVTGKMSVLEH